jgi:hypothetical protein
MVAHEQGTCTNEVVGGQKVQGHNQAIPRAFSYPMPQSVWQPKLVHLLLSLESLGPPAPSGSTSVRISLLYVRFFLE